LQGRGFGWVSVTTQKEGELFVEQQQKRTDSESAKIIKINEVSVHHHSQVHKFN